MNATITIRPYEQVDAAGVIALWQACQLVRPWNDPATDIAFCVGSPNAALFVGEIDGDARPAASVMVGHDGHRGWVYYLAVDPAHQGAGFGRRMIEQAEDWLKSRGVPKVQLMIRTGNEQAERFYDAIGYERQAVTVMARWLNKDSES